MIYIFPNTKPALRPIPKQIVFSKHVPLCYEIFWNIGHLYLICRFIWNQHGINVRLHMHSQSREMSADPHKGPVTANIFSPVLCEAIITTIRLPFAPLPLQARMHAWTVVAHKAEWDKLFSRCTVLKRRLQIAGEGRILKHFLMTEFG